jgi:hypothetical protein
MEVVVEEVLNVMEVVLNVEVAVEVVPKVEVVVEVVPKVVEVVEGRLCLLEALLLCIFSR